MTLTHTQPLNDITARSVREKGKGGREKEREREGGRERERRERDDTLVFYHILLYIFFPFQVVLISQPEHMTSA